MAKVLWLHLRPEDPPDESSGASSAIIQGFVGDSKLYGEPEGEDTSFGTGRWG